MSPPTPHPVQLASRASLERAATHLAAGGLLVETASSLTLFAPTPLLVQVGDAPPVPVDATPVNPAPGGGYFVQVAAGQAAALADAVRTALTALDGPEGGDADAETDDVDDVDEV